MSMWAIQKDGSCKGCSKVVVVASHSAERGDLESRKTARVEPKFLLYKRKKKN